MICLVFECVFARVFNHVLLREFVHVFESEFVSVALKSKSLCPVHVFEVVLYASK